MFAIRFQVLDVRARLVLITAFLLLTFGVGNRLSAAAVATAPSTVMPQQTIFYGVYGSGDVVFRLTSNSQPQCAGYWLRSCDTGIKNELAALMIAIASQTMLVVNADDAVIWTGSGSNY